MDIEEEGNKQNLTVLVLRHLTNPEVFCYPVRETNLCACLRAIQLAEDQKLHATIRLPSGSYRTAGQVLHMFRLEQYVDWEKAAKQKMTYDDMVVLGIEPERRHIVAPRSAVVSNRRRTPRGGCD